MGTTAHQSLGELIRRHRRQAGLSQEELAERAGISPRGLVYLERGERRPQPHTARRLADALHLAGDERAHFLALTETEADTGRSSAVRTFLIADIRGYTRFTQERGDEAAARLAMHFADIADNVVHEHGGDVTELRGDEVLAAFTSSRQALRAALALRERCRSTAERDPSLPLKIGIGLDAGEAVPVKGGFRGKALNLAARMCSIADEGDVFCSESVMHLAGKMEGIAYADRGVATLKGISEPVRVIQVAREGELPDDIPPFQPGTETHPNNLPVEATPFIGRSREIQGVVDLLRRPSVRLVTLTGPGGTGKSRLAVHVGASVLDDFPDGVFFISLAALVDPDLVLPTVAQTLAISEEQERSVADRLSGYLQDKRILLILDNFEQVRDAATDVSGLLSACPGLSVLITSRAVLNEYGEYVYDVPPLGVPDARETSDLEALSRSESVTLFVERARAALAGFSLTPDNAPVIAEVCRRLDGLPLAIELAAARTRILPPAAMLQRLESRLQLLTGGGRGRPERQQTLRGTIEWSYSLLDEDEPRLFARLAVFAGGCTLEAAEAVCSADAGPQMEVLDGISGLVENSLVRQVGRDEPRFVMLETIREYARSVLDAEGATRAARARHAAYFLALGEEADEKLRGPEQGTWLRRLDEEHDNLRAALSWFVDEHDVDGGLRLAGSLWRFWSGRGYLAEGREWLEAVLEMGQGSLPARANAFVALANIVWLQGDLDRAEALHRQGLALREQLGDRPGIARSLNNLGVVAQTRGDLEGAARWYQQGWEVARAARDRWGTALLLTNLSGVLGHQGDYDRAIEFGEESLRLLRELGDRATEGHVLNNLMSVALDREDYSRAATLQSESLTLYRELGHHENVSFCLEGAAKLLVAVGMPADAARLWGAAEALREVLGQPLPEVNREDREPSLQRARAELGHPAFEAAWNEGVHFTVEEAEEYALAVLGTV